METSLDSFSAYCLVMLEEASQMMTEYCWDNFIDYYFFLVGK